MGGTTVVADVAGRLGGPMRGSAGIGGLLVDPTVSLEERIAILRGIPIGTPFTRPDLLFGGLPPGVQAESREIVARGVAVDPRLAEVLGPNGLVPRPDPRLAGVPDERLAGLQASLDAHAAPRGAGHRPDRWERRLVTRDEVAKAVAIADGREPAGFQERVATGASVRLREVARYLLEEAITTEEYARGEGGGWAPTGRQLEGVGALRHLDDKFGSNEYRSLDVPKRRTDPGVAGRLHLDGRMGGWRSRRSPARTPRRGRGWRGRGGARLSRGR